MTPFEFWYTLFSNIFNFINYLNQLVFTRLFQFILGNTMILIIVAFMVIHYVIGVFFKL